MKLLNHNASILTRPCLFSSIFYLVSCRVTSKHAMFINFKLNGDVTILGAKKLKFVACIVKTYMLVACISLGNLLHRL